MTSRLLPALLGALLLAVGGCTDAEPGSVDVVEVLEDQNYYYACGNEVLILPDGRTFYPLHPEDQSEFDASPYATAAAIAAGHLSAVAPPGPGDDTGTVTIYADGMAHWASDSGHEAWLTEDELEYGWIC